MSCKSTLLFYSFIYRDRLLGKGSVALEAANQSSGNSVGHDAVLSVPERAEAHNGDHDSGNGLLDRVGKGGGVLGPGVVDEGCRS